MADNYASDKAVSTGHADAPFESHSPHEMTAGEYAATRISTLKPPMHKAPNPIRLLRLLSGKQWLFFLCGFIAWVGLPRSDHDEMQSLTLLGLGCVRFLHCQSDNQRTLRIVRQNHHANHLGDNIGVDVQIGGIHHLRTCRRSVRTQVALHRQQSLVRGS